MGFKTTPCKGCGRQIIWAHNSETNKRVPLDAKAIVYDLVHHEGDGDAVVIRTNTAYVSHFNTCPRANDFSGSKRP